MESKIVSHINSHAADLNKRHFYPRKRENNINDSKSIQYRHHMGNCHI